MKSMRINQLMTRPLLLALGGAIAVPSPGLARRSEDLMNIENTSALRNEQRAADVAAAVFVITHGEWRFSSRLSVMALRQNLFDAAHGEFAGPTSLFLATQVRRSASLRLRWTSR